MTQKERILSALERAGRDGIKPEDFLLPNVIDGGKPILRVAARIDDLRKEGHRINTDTTGVTAVYTLVGSVKVTSPAVGGAESTDLDGSVLAVGDVALSASDWRDAVYDGPEVRSEDLVWV